jgi:hypothetical protein
LRGRRHFEKWNVCSEPFLFWTFFNLFFPMIYTSWVPSLVSRNNEFDFNFKY